MGGGQARHGRISEASTEPGLGGRDWAPFASSIAESLAWLQRSPASGAGIGAVDEDGKTIMIPLQRSPASGAGIGDVLVHR